MSKMQKLFASSTHSFHGAGKHVAFDIWSEYLELEMSYRNVLDFYLFISTKGVVTVLTMFPRQDVGAKGSSPVQEPLRQPVYAEAE